MPRHGHSSPVGRRKHASHIAPSEAIRKIDSELHVSPESQHLVSFRPPDVSAYFQCIMSEIFSTQAREVHQNRTVAKMHMEVLGLARKIDADIASRGFAYLSHHVLLKEVFALLHFLADELLAFDQRWSDHELRRANVDPQYSPHNPFSVEAEQSMVQLIEGQSKSLPRQVAHNSKKLHRSTESMQDFANHVKSDVLYKIRRGYGERREAFNLSVWELQGRRPSALGQTANAVSDVDNSPIVSTHITGHQFVFVRDGVQWRVTGFGETGTFPNLKGLKQIHRLLQTPNTPVPVLELFADSPTSAQAVDKGSYQPTFDKEALKEVFDEQQRTQAELANARRDNDAARVVELEKEVADLSEQIKAGTGLGLTSRNLNVPLRNACAAVHGTLATAYLKLRQAEPPLTRTADHLEASTRRESTVFVYAPADQAPPWRL